MKTPILFSFIYKINKTEAPDWILYNFMAQTLAHRKLESAMKIRINKKNRVRILYCLFVNVNFGNAVLLVCCL